MLAQPRLNQFLDAVCDESRPIIPASDVAVVVAHPDDETVGCGALISRLLEVSVVVVTNGAPDDGVDARAHGFSDEKAYAAVRSGELDHALQIAGVSADRTIRLGVADQQAARQMPQVVCALEQLFEKRGIAVVLTHAYEGGHPDHDAVGCCVQVAASRAGRAIGIIEMPYYRLGRSGEEIQNFPAGSGTLRVLLTETERAIKRSMIEAHRTQKDVLAAFSLDREQFRVAPQHDFSKPPNGGRVLYDARPWGLTSVEWLACAKAVLEPASMAPCNR